MIVLLATPSRGSFGLTFPVETLTVMSKSRGSFRMSLHFPSWHHSNETCEPIVSLHQCNEMTGVRHCLCDIVSFLQKHAAHCISSIEGMAGGSHDIVGQRLDIARRICLFS